MPDGRECGGYPGAGEAGGDTRAARAPAPDPAERAMTALPVSALSRRACPTWEEARWLGRDMLADDGTRWPHVRTAGFVATRLTTLFDDDEAALLVAAATLHDIGYSSRVARTGFHPLDGAVFLHAEGFPDRLAGLIAHHSLAVITAPLYGVHDLAERFPQEQSLLVDALVYADMHSAPDGRIVGTEWRLADIARRRPGPHQEVRAELLRASSRRVEAAIRDPERRIEVPPRAPA
jgi:hypothetical protein